MFTIIRSKEKPNCSGYRIQATRNFRNKKREYLKDKINELATNSKNKNIRDLYRGINDFKRGYQPGSNLVKCENGDLLADSHNILNRLKNYFTQLLKYLGSVMSGRLNVHRAEPLFPDAILVEFEIAIAIMKKYKVIKFRQK
jgi:hypothetical protein